MKLKRILKACVVMLGMMVVLSGCGAGGQESKESEPTQKLYPVTIDGSEVLVGQTTVKTLLDSGLKVTVSEKNAAGEIEMFEIDPTVELDANTYYSGGTVWITDHVFANISMVTDDKAIPMSDAVIASLSFSMPAAEESDLALITLDGVPVTEIDRKKSGEMFPDFTGDDYQLLQYGSDYKYSLGFDTEDSSLQQFSVSKEYDVDWSTKK